MSKFAIGFWAVLLLPFCSLAQDLYKAEDVFVSFFSDATIEDIAAENHKATSFLNTKTGEMVFSIPIREFEFEKSLMKEHFNENYMEVEKGKNYERATFKGKITNLSEVNLDEEGEHEVTVEGDLMIHNVSKPYKTTGKLVRKGDVITGEAKFMVRLEDHKVKIPKMLFSNIAEEVEVTAKPEYKLFKK